MMSPALLILTTVAVASIGQYREATMSRGTTAGETYQNAITITTYRLASARRLINQVKCDADGDQRMGDRAFRALTGKEGFTHGLLHGQGFSQNCNEAPTVDGMLGKMFACPAGSFDNPDSSDRLEALLKHHQGT